MKDKNIQAWWWVRHAPPINPKNLCYGQFDIEADYSNAQRFSELAATLPHGVDTIWLSSPLQRSFKSAVTTLAAKGVDIVPVKEPQLMEQSFGDWEVMTKVQASREPSFKAYYADPENGRPPNGESMRDLFNRVGARVDQLLLLHADKDNVVVFAHGGTNRAALSKATGMAVRQTLKEKIEPLDGVKLFYDRGHGLWLPQYERF